MSDNPGEKPAENRKRRGCFRWLVRGVAAGILVLVAAVYFGFLLPFWGVPFGMAYRGNPPLTPPWALECWLWEDDVNTAEYVWELLDGYAEHDIPVRAILIDSPWSLRYNDFAVDEERYPDPDQFFEDLQDRGYRVVLWMTGVVNRENRDTAVRDGSALFEEARSGGYLADNGRIYNWWKGRGGLIDYTNPEAMAWWRGLQQQAFDWGVDGWKLDGAATYFSTRVRGYWLPYGETYAGRISTRRYMNHYYRDEYEHGLSQNPEFVTLSRSIDSVMPWVHPWGFSPIDASPVNWVGDTQHVWNDEERGLERALRTTLRSARLGYNVVGSDIGGYHGNMPIPPTLYIRWTQFSAFSGLFLNGGHAERRLWMRSADELDIIRRYSWLRTELVPYIYSYVVVGHEGGPPLMRPLEPQYHYMFGEDFLVAPIYEDSPTRTVSLPEGRWRYFFDDTTEILGPTTFTREYPLEEYPVYVRDGAIIPMHIEREYTQIGERNWQNYLTLNLYPFGHRHMAVHHTDGSGIMEVTVDNDGELNVALDGVVQPHILRILAQDKPGEILRNGQALTEEEEWRYDTSRNRVIVRGDLETGVKYELNW